jgi:osmotically-inducible protein OsmY
MLTSTDVPTRIAHRFYHWVESELIALALRRLQSSPYAELRRITCEMESGVLRLHGAVPRYYLKQHAYRIVADLKGVRHVENDIVVGKRTELVLNSAAGAPAA